MKKFFIACAAVCAVMTLASCSSSKESAYRKAYEKAKAQEQAQQQPVTTPVEQPVQQQPVVTPLEQAPAQTTVVDNNDNTPVRQENLEVVNGEGLKAYSVVVGAFGVRANAESLQSRLKAAGYPAQLAFNKERNMYRVIATTFDSKANAVESRNSLRSNYPEAWLLMAK